ncbi:hypothetical protein [Rhodopila globiformis]|uniref:Uncharacterized protein n=1 Tax=Rhodopila globiformis TaxID=1071 RepID=A0A2S6NFL8_RHOGL|nr:hypothetical protein [Rhodopila globiformis]PPQ33422.1 hypothetical protein CCS01_14380 [Rhodopila globiformis]
MTPSALHRRTLLRGGATFGCLAFAGLPAAPGQAATETAPLTGVLAGWLVIQPDGGGRFDLMALDAEQRPARLVASETIKPAASVAAAAREAQMAAVWTVAASWHVAARDCACGWGRIDHLPSGRTIPFTLWTDFA